MKNLFEVIKANKKGILKKALIIGGTIAGLAVAAAIVKPKSNDMIEIPAENAEDSTEEVSDEETVEE
jgi:hypothetical protein